VNWELRRVNLSLTIREHHRISPSGSPRKPERHLRWSRVSIYPSGGVSDMSVDNVRPEVNLLFAFTLTIAGAIAVGLPMAITIIWVCS
jgi:hypothetical protein